MNVKESNEQTASSTNQKARIEDLPVSEQQQGEVTGGAGTGITVDISGSNR